MRGKPFGRRRCRRFRIRRRGSRWRRRRFRVCRPRVDIRSWGIALFLQGRHLMKSLEILRFRKVLWPWLTWVICWLALKLNHFRNKDLLFLQKTLLERESTFLALWQLLRINLWLMTLIYVWIWKIEENLQISKRWLMFQSKTSLQSAIYCSNMEIRSSRDSQRQFRPSSIKHSSQLVLFWPTWSHLLTVLQYHLQIRTTSFLCCLFHHSKSFYLAYSTKIMATITSIGYLVIINITFHSPWLKKSVCLVILFAVCSIGSFCTFLINF